MKMKFCREIECEPPFGGKEACEFYHDGICLTKTVKVFVTNITKDTNTHMGNGVWLHHVVCDCTIEGGQTEEQAYRIFVPQEYEDVMAKGYYEIPACDSVPES